MSKMAKNDDHDGSQGFESKVLLIIIDSVSKSMEQQLITIMSQLVSINSRLQILENDLKHYKRKQFQQIRSKYKSSLLANDRMTFTGTGFEMGTTLRTEILNLSSQYDSSNREHFFYLLDILSSTLNEMENISPKYQQRQQTKKMLFIYLIRDGNIQSYDDLNKLYQILFSESVDKIDTSTFPGSAVESIKIHVLPYLEGFQAGEQTSATSNGLLILSRMISTKFESTKGDTKGVLKFKFAISNMMKEFAQENKASHSRNPIYRSDQNGGNGTNR